MRIPSHLGFPDGMIRVYDDRIPSHEALVMQLNNLSGSEVKGIDLFTHDGRTVLAAAAKDGRIVVCDTRKSKVCIHNNRYSNVFSVY